jgi:hypothetical protein
VLVRELDDEVLILDTVADRIHRLNSSAALVWRMHEDGASERAIADALIEKYDVSPDRALTDVRDMIRTLRRLDVCSRLEPAANGDELRPKQGG